MKTNWQKLKNSIAEFIDESPLEISDEEVKRWRNNGSLEDKEWEEIK